VRLLRIGTRRLNAADRLVVASQPCRAFASTAPRGLTTIAPLASEQSSKSKEMQSVKKAVGAWLVSAAGLAACGGGGSADESPAWTGGSFQGQWDGSSFSLLVTPNNEFWGLEDTGNGLSLYRGNVTTSGTSFTATFTAYSGVTKTTVNSTGHYSEKSSLSGTSTAAGSSTSSSFTASYAAAYDTPATLAALAGSYHEAGGTTLVTVAANGAITGTSSVCTFTGTATPDASGKHFYRLSLTYGQGTGCPLSGVTVTGIGIPSGTAVATGLVTADGSTGAASVLVKN
jgi:hypothetical protein